MTSVLVLAALTLGQPMPKEVNLSVSPAEPPRNLLRWQLLPPLLDERPGECLALVLEANQALKDAFPTPDALGQIAEELQEVLKTPLAEVDRAKLRANLEKARKPLDLLERAANAGRCDWGKLREELRTKGLNANLVLVQEFRRLVPLLAARARLDILEDRPHDAVRTLALGLRLAQRIGEGPTLITHLVGVASTTILLDQADAVLTHPRCPNLYGALTAIPRPFLSLRPAMEGERMWVYGTFPAVTRLITNPEGPLPTEEEMKALTGSDPNGQLRALVGEMQNPAQRILLGLSIQARHEAAIRDLVAGGFPEEKIRKWPPLLVAIAHGLTEYEEKLGRMQQAMALPFPQATVLLAKLEAEVKPRNPLLAGNTPAIHLSPLLLPAVGRVMLATTRGERRLDALRTVEALRLHAAKTGAWPKSLADIQAVPVPDDPMTGKPFEYRVEGDTAILRGPAPPKERADNELIYRLKLNPRTP